MLLQTNSHFYDEIISKKFQKQLNPAHVQIIPIYVHNNRKTIVIIGFYASC